MNMTDLYNFIKIEYGERGAWISDIAVSLGLNRRQANALTYAAGYRYGKAASGVVPLHIFSSDPAVMYIYDNYIK